MDEDAGPVRRSRFAGSWYSGDPSELSSMVSRLLEEAESGPARGRLVGLIVPHAGLLYSGPVAAAAYRRLREESFETVVLLGPSHRAWFDGLAVYPEGSFATPLGLLRVDRELALRFENETPRARPMPEVHAAEHCLEMQFPFLQVVLPEAKVLPVMMGKQSAENVVAAARALAAVAASAAKPVLLVASSDLSHYEDRERARELDGEVLDRVERFDADALLDLVRSDSRHACGGGPMVAVMKAARELGASRARILRYADSGDVTGETNAVVGYLAAAFVGEPSS